MADRLLSCIRSCHYWACRVRIVKRDATNSVGSFKYLHCFGCDVCTRLWINSRSASYRARGRSLFHNGARDFLFLDHYRVYNLRFFFTEISRAMTPKSTSAGRAQACRSHHVRGAVQWKTWVHVETGAPYAGGGRSHVPQPWQDEYSAHTLDERRTVRPARLRFAHGVFRAVPPPITTLQNDPKPCVETSKPFSTSIRQPPSWKFETLRCNSCGS